MGKIKDLTGKRFGRLTVIEDSGKRRNGSVLWTCLCDCGKTAFVHSIYLTKGFTRSCGCLSVEVAKRIKRDLTGKRFGRLTVIKVSGKRAKSGIFWTCLCDCGKTTITRGTSLTAGNTRSCGCLSVEVARERRFKARRFPDEYYRIGDKKYRSKYLTDSYVKERLTSNSNLKSKDIPQDLIELKREQLKLHRGLRNEQ